MISGWLLVDDKLVNITPITLVFVGDISIVNGLITNL